MGDRRWIKGVFFTFGSAILFTPATSQANKYEELTKDQKQKIQKGEQVEIHRMVEGEIWPETTVYQKVGASPEEAMAVFADYGRQHEFVYRLRSSVPCNTENPCKKRIQYQMDLPSLVEPFFSREYELENTITYLGPERGYQMIWHLVEAKSIKMIEGSAFIEPLPDGSSLVTYTNHVEPMKDNLIMRSRGVLERVERGGGEALDTIVTQIRKEKADDLSKKAEFLSKTEAFAKKATRLARKANALAEILREKLEAQKKKSDHVEALENQALTLESEIAKIPNSQMTEALEAADVATLLGSQIAQLHKAVGH